MTGFAKRFAAAAQGLIGTPYLLYGRNPATGLDCVGFVLSALGTAGRPPVEIPAYRLRNACIDRHRTFAERNGFRSAGGPILGGDLLLVTPGCAQYHLLVSLGSSGCAHAHAGARKVIRDATPETRLLAAHWRLLELD